MEPVVDLRPLHHTGVGVGVSVSVGSVKDWDNTTVRKWLSKRKNGMFTTCLEKLDNSWNGRMLMKMSAEKLDANLLGGSNIVLATALFRGLREEEQRLRVNKEKEREGRRVMIRGNDVT